MISEALANVYKHSGATTAHVRAHPDDRHLVIEITDDGHGGARPGDGSTGLRHRVEGVGGGIAQTLHTKISTVEKQLSAINSAGDRRTEPARLALQPARPGRPHPPAQHEFDAGLRHLRRLPSSARSVPSQPRPV
ncbi:hypothetical protein ABZ894_02670 [Nocardia beijingensis]|uniref:hypothetical protein n=1 Tax=Nocardia beijingensis TaxID=95162 RepID=UPI0033D5EE44